MENQNYKEYNYSSVWKRLTARLLDFLFISILTISTSLLFFINSKFQIKDIFKPANENTPNLEGWRVFCISINTFILNFIYFCLIPTFTKGFTLFKYAFKMRLGTLDKTRSFFLKIFKRELLIWMLFYSFSIIASIIIWVSNDTNGMINAILSMDMNPKNNLFGWGVFIKLMYAICSIITMVLIVFMLFNNHKKAIQDNISSTFVYDYKKPLEEKPIPTSFKLVSNEENEKQQTSVPTSSLLENNKKYWEKLQSSSLFNELSIKKEKAKKLDSSKEQEQNE